MKTCLFGGLTRVFALVSTGVVCQIASAQVPSITAVAPLSGPIGAQVTINGANFSANPANDIVYFGAVTANVLSAASNSLTVTVPVSATYWPVTVTAGGLTAFSSEPFDVTFPSSGTFDSSSLAPQVNLGTGSTPTGMNLVDLDGDGKPDLVVANWGARTISVFRNISTNGTLTPGSFAPRVDFAVGANPYFMAVGDLTGDGKQDLVVANSGGDTISIFQNISSPGSFTSDSFASRLDLTVGAGPYQVAIGDLDGDGLADLVVANGSGNTISVLRNLGAVAITSNSFAPRVDFTTGNGPKWVAIGDLTGDGKPDLVVANAGSGTLSIFQNTSSPGVMSSGSFAAPVSLTVGGLPFCAVIGDLDGDGKPDIAVANYANTSVSIFHNVSSVGVLDANSFASPFNLAAPSPSQNVALGDLDGDGRLDLVVAASGGSVSVFHNIGTNGTLVSGSFASSVDFPAQNNTLSVVIGDLDGDGRPDVVAANDYSSTLSIFRNTIAPAVSTAPAITAQPQNGSVAEGGTVSLSVVASGQSPLTYQWFVNPAATSVIASVAGATNATLTLTNVQTSQAGGYWVVVINSYGSVVSATAAVTVYQPPVITLQPQNQSVRAGNSAIFIAAAGGNGPLSYQWQFDGGNINGATNALLTVTNAQAGNAGTYDVVVSSPFGSVESSNAVLTVAISTFQVASTSVPGGTTVNVPINLVALGDENAAGFSVNFDPSVLAYSNAAAGTGATNAAMIVNASQAASGQVGIEIALPSGTAFPAGTQQLVQLTFQAAILTNAVATAISFGDEPIARQVSGASANSLPANFLPGTVTLAAAVLAGDVWPRTNGDHVVNIFDWVQEGRFVAGLDTISNANEFQRADCAPRATMGDGVVNVADWVQVGRYAAGLDPLTIAGGPTGPFDNVEAVRGHPRGGPETPAEIVSFGAPVQGATGNSVAVQLAAQGVENALSFTVAYDPNAIGFAGASLGSGAAGAVLNVNTNLALGGQIGCALALPPGTAFAAGLQKVVILNFGSVSYSNTAALLFGNSPVTQGLADTNANSLVATFQNGTLAVGGLAWPQLSSAQSGNSLVLSWPDTGAGFGIETASALDGPWSVVAGTPVTSGGVITLTVPLSSSTAFYRLRHQ
jgi:hypothetical protein